MTSKISLFDHFARPLTELNGAATTPRSWVLNDVGRCEFSVSTSDPACSEINLQYGNLIHITHLPGMDAAGVKGGQLPPWTGILLPKRDWNYGSLPVVAYAAEGILSFCPMPFTKISGTPADLFRQIIELSNKFIHTYGGGITIRPGVIENVDKTFSDDLRLSAYEHIKTVVERAGMYWDITGSIDDRGALELRANLYISKGIETGAELNNLNTEGTSGTMLSEQGNPINVVIGYSQANTPQTRYQAIATHSGSIGDYGPLGQNVVFMGLRDTSATAHAADQLALSGGRPVRKIPGRRVLDRGLIFSSLAIGNRLTVSDNYVGFKPGGGFGFSAQAQIVSMKYNDLSNNVELNLEVVS